MGRGCVAVRKLEDGTLEKKTVVRWRDEATTLCSQIHDVLRNPRHETLRFARARLIEKSTSALDRNIRYCKFRLRVTHHPIPPKRDQGMHRTPTEPSRNHHASLLQ